MPTSVQLYSQDVGGGNMYGPVKVTGTCPPYAMLAVAVSTHTDVLNLREVTYRCV
jgi:hypothetical protein